MVVERVVGRVRAAAGEHAEVGGAGDAGVGQRAPRPQRRRRVVAPRAARRAAVLCNTASTRQPLHSILVTTEALRFGQQTSMTFYFHRLIA